MQVKALRGNDFIRISDFTKEEIVTMLDAGKALKLENARGVRHEASRECVRLVESAWKRCKRVKRP